ncbi:MAG: DUF2157 domain-containing protein [Bacteroidota bacterium]
MDQHLLNKLHTEGTLSDESFAKIKQRETDGLYSVHWELKTLLYLGILALTTGLGITIYKNIDTIGHQAILVFIALIVIACFIYCFKRKLPFSKTKVQSPDTFFDYLLLLGTLCFLIFIGYLQFEYKVFGDRYGMATFIPMLVLFYIAYDFDHIGILNMAIANLGLWLGISVTPKKLLKLFDFDSQTLTYTYLGFGLLLLAFGWATKHFDIKKHFKFSYQHYGVHVSFIAMLSGYTVHYDNGFAWLWLMGVFALGYVIYRDAMEHHSFYFLLLTVLYSYIALSCLVMRGLMSSGAIELIMMYFITSSIGLVSLLIYLNKKLKAA